MGLFNDNEKYNCHWINNFNEYTKNWMMIFDVKSVYLKFSRNLLIIIE